MVNYGETVAEFFIKYRARGGLSQADLARLLKVSPQYINNIENGRNLRPRNLALSLSRFIVDPRMKNHLRELLDEASWEHTRERRNALKKRLK